MSTKYEIKQKPAGVAIELTGIGDTADQLLAAFGACAAGECSCPTREYEKVQTMDVKSGTDVISITLSAKRGREFDASEISRCLDHTVEQVAKSGPSMR